MELNNRARTILELARKYSNEAGYRTLGSEYLILAMYETEDSLCHFLLNEYDVKRDEIVKATNEIFILRKRSGEYNSSIESILQTADGLASGNKISEEHMFMSVLQNRNTIACNILENLGLSIDDLIDDVKEIYDFESNGTDELTFVYNITKRVKCGEGSRFIGRRDYLKRMDVILHRRFKSNPLLIGNAGVGKSAMVEGYARYVLDMGSDVSILGLNLTSMLAGTRYRGDFEERFDRFINEIACRKNVVIFIDEIHTIMNKDTEGNLDVANMLKPFLARSDIRLIGATTLEEYNKSIVKDKALQRRFQPIFIQEPSLVETKEIMFGIKDDYEKYHGVKITDEVLEYLIYESDRRINNRYRPDKCIDLFDDVMSMCHIEGRDSVSKSDIDSLLFSDTTGCKLVYGVLDKYRWLYNMDLLTSSPLLKLMYSGDNDGLDSLVLDLLTIFNLSYECVLDVDLQIFKGSSTLSSLVGAPPGYVGYEDEGVLSKHVVLYPMSLVVFKGFSMACGAIQAFVLNMLNKGYFVDSMGKRIELKNCIVIVEGVRDGKRVGFCSTGKGNTYFDEHIVGVESLCCLNEEYINTFRRFDCELSFDFDVRPDNKREVDEYLYRNMKNNLERQYAIHSTEVFKEK